jgi:hypothetical protein
MLSVVPTVLAAGTKPAMSSYVYHIHKNKLRTVHRSIIPRKTERNRQSPRVENQTWCRPLTSLVCFVCIGTVRVVRVIFV